MARFLSEQDVAQLLTMPLALEAVQQAMGELAGGAATNVPRERLRAGPTTMHFMQGHVPSQGAMGFKVYTVHNGVVRFLLQIYDTANGQLLGVMQAGHLGRLRTGAASGVATRWLAREDAQTLGLFGSGRQAAAQVEAVCAVRAIRTVKVFARNRDRLATFCQDLSQRLQLEVRPAASARETVEGSDIVSTITSSETPLFDGAWLAAGTHINAAGSNMLSRRELDDATLARCDRIVTDSREVARRECGDLLPLMEKGKLAWGQVAELGDLVIGRTPGRSGAGQITCFESHGLAVQDVAVGARLLVLAAQQGVGTALPPFFE
jgi:ornithine cyclodeaminase